MKGVVAVGLVSFVVAAVAVHGALLWLSPTWATDHYVARALAKGRGLNVLTYGKPPRAGANNVPLASPDTLGSRAYLDLAKGPQVIEGLRPNDCAYWSASVFAHNTDTVLVRSDRDSPDRKVSIGLRMASQALGEPVRDDVVLPSRTGVVLIRCFMRDRTDKAYVAQLSKELRGLTLRPAHGASA